MKRKYVDYLVLLNVFLIILFSNKVNYIIKVINNDFSFVNIGSYLNKEILNENIELKKYIKLKDDIYPNCILTKVKYNNIYDFKNEIILYKGVNENIKKGQAIVNDKGLVGIITKVNTNTSQGKLITNKDNKISVKINNNYGILDFDKELIVNNLLDTAVINVGDKVYTSGITNIPGDIYIGKVTKVIKDDLNIEQKAIVEMAVNLKEISYVVIL